MRGRVFRTTTFTKNKAWRPIIYGDGGREVFYGTAYDTPEQAWTALQVAAKKHGCEDIRPFEPFVPKQEAS